MEEAEEQFEGDELDLDNLGGATLAEIEEAEDGEEGGEQGGESEQDAETEEARIDRLANERADQKLGERLRGLLGGGETKTPERTSFKPVETYDPSEIRNVTAADAAAYVDAMDDAMDEIEEEYGTTLSKSEIRQIRTTLRTTIAPEALEQTIKNGGHRSLADMLVGQKVRKEGAAAVRNPARPAPVGKQGTRTGTTGSKATQLTRKFEQDYGKGSGYESASKRDTQRLKDLL